MTETTYPMPLAALKQMEYQLKQAHQLINDSIKMLSFTSNADFNMARGRTTIALDKLKSALYWVERAQLPF